ncbi:hypothetical protein SAMN05421766_102145 [Zobellia uliginosa]|uniref:Uncharacterized protein n=1 Tax=Zobellia uliginosa TaxID=143224 RepID=A0ABY1KLH3_9FLAO|nr:hypothetical protein [Zobellia uliginosa]SIS47566.1 hypothetical protein SAMN05421766_102145 [Zobellia uliginosa]
MEQLKKNQKAIIISLFFTLIALLSIYTWRKEASLNSNRKITIGRVTDVNYSIKDGYISYEFYVDGEHYDTSDPDDAGWPKYFRQGKAVKNQFYPVEYDLTDPYNSKIKITQTPISLKTVLENGTKVKGLVEKSSPVSDSYVDLYISYTFLKRQFKFRTRLHRDSLPCGTADSCPQKEIDLIISDYFPDANDLYYSSYDRIAREKAKRRNPRYR